MSATSLGARVRSDLWERAPGNFAPLDGMRGFASVIIVFYHVALFTAALGPEARAAGRMRALLPLLNGLWSGIDIFFVLSGFLIGRLLILELDKTGTIAWRSFVVRRFCRIFPAYYLILSLSVLVVSRIHFPLYFLLYGTTDRDTLVRESWTNFLYVNNYLHPGNQPGVFSWGWSLCIEEHFYLVLPLLLWALFQSAAPAVQIAILACCVLGPLGGRAAQYVADPNLSLMKGFYYYSHNRFDEIMMGVLVAYFYALRRDALARWVSRAGHAVWVTGILLVGSVWVFGGLQANGSFALVWQFWMMALGSALLLLNGLFQDNPLTRFFAHRAWYPLARISYGTYLIHPFVLFGVLHFWLTARAESVYDISAGELVILYILVMSLTSLLAAVMFVSLEGPFLRRGMRWARRLRGAEVHESPARTTEVY